MRPVFCFMNVFEGRTVCLLKYSSNTFALPVLNDYGTGDALEPCVWYKPFVIFLSLSQTHTHRYTYINIHICTQTHVYKFKHP